jgi:RNA polymerase sigma factor (sigma-70 family)
MGSLRRLAIGKDGGPLSDAQLLESHLTGGDEVYFEALIRRHGPMVYGVCRRVLGDVHEAEDAFQATFLVLVRKARSIASPEKVGGWLHGVALSTAQKAKIRSARRGARERKATRMAGHNDQSQRFWQELLPLLDRELHALPEKYRLPIVLCELEGKSRKQASEQLRWAEGTVASRLSRGRALLAERMKRHAPALSGASLAAALSTQAASAALPPSLIGATIKAASVFALGHNVAAKSIPVNVLTLAQGVLKAMLLTRLKYTSVAIFAMAAAVWAGQWGYHALAAEPWREAAPASEQVARKQKIDDKPAPKVPSPEDSWPEGTTVQGRVVDHRGVPVANAEILLLGKERIIVEAPRRTWFVWPTKSDIVPPSTRTDTKGEFSILRKKGAADRLAVISEDPLLWVVSRRTLPSVDKVEIKLPPSGSLAIHCDLPGKEAKQPVMIQLRSFDGKDWDTDALRFHPADFSATNPGETVFEHLPPGHYAVQRYLRTQMGQSSMFETGADRLLAKVEPNQRASIRFERKIGRPLAIQVRGLEGIELRYAWVTIDHMGPEEHFPPDGRVQRQGIAFDLIAIKSDGRFTTDPIPPGKYTMSLTAVRASTLEQSGQQADFSGFVNFTVAEQGEMPRVELIAKPLAEKDRRLNTDHLVRVVDEAGKAVSALQAMVHTADKGYSRWTDGRDGLVSLSLWSSFQDAEVLDVLIRADGYAPNVLRYEGDERKKLRQGKITITLKQGQKVDVRFRLPAGLAWPKGVAPEAYFGDYAWRVHMMRQPSNRAADAELDFNMLNLRSAGPNTFELRLTPDTPPFYVAIHAPGFLQHFDAGPFTLADIKEGVLDIEVARPATLDIQFDPRANADQLPFKSVSLQVFRKLDGNAVVEVAREVANSVKHQLKLIDLAPGDYLVDVRTVSKESSPKVPSILPGIEIDPGAYLDRKNVTLRSAQAEQFQFGFTPFAPEAFRGQRSAVLRIRMADGSPAAGRKVTVGYYDGHYGTQVVFSGTVPQSGSITLTKITDRPTANWDRGAYSVWAGDKHLGFFDVTKKDGTPEIEFTLPPAAGDRAPNIELVNVASGQKVQLDSLRGKVVCVEFWATWCGPCQPAMESLNHLAIDRLANWKDQVAIVPISIDAKLDQVKRHIAQRGWDNLAHHWSGHTSSTDFDAPAARAFGVSGVPESILIGPDGRILWRGHPMDKTDGQSLQTRIEAALGK